MDKEKVKHLLWDNWFVKYIILPMLIFYCIGVIFSFCFANACIFPGSYSPSSYQDSNDIIKLTTSDGMKISARYLPNPAADFTILFSHGNGEDLGDNEAFFSQMHDLGFSVFAYDYHGYGTSEGSTSEKNCYQDIDASFDYLTNTLHVPANRIIVFGRSVGGGPSAYLVARQPVAGLILQSTFTSAYSALTRIPLLPFDKFHSLDRMSRIHCPVLVMHGKDDQTIPFEHGVKLYEEANFPKQFLWVDGAGHNDLPQVDRDAYNQAILQFATQVKEERNISRLR